MASTSDRHARIMVPIPDRPAPALTTYDARDPGTAFPPIEPDVGYESGTTVGADHTAAGSRFTGRINWVQLGVGTDDHDHNHRSGGTAPHRHGPALGAGPEGEGITMVQHSAGDGTGAEAEQRRARIGGGAIASLTGAGALLVFMFQNTEDVTVKFLVWEFTWPVWLLILVAALFGALVWFGLGVLRRHRRRVERRDERRD